MKIIEERQFDYIPDKVFKKLSKRDRDNLRSYRGTYRWYKDNDDKLKSLEKEITKRKERTVCKRTHKEEQRTRPPPKGLSIFLVCIKIKEQR